jgi:hypothetical protein
MKVEELEQHDHTKVRVDLCFGCGGIWFGHLVSVQLAPSAIITLFKEIYAHRTDTRRPLNERLSCPRCSGRLSHSFDLSKAGRFSYFNCTRGDGRFTPFHQFLREKQFVRVPTTTELEHIRAQVGQIKCSECGAPIDLQHDSECQYCHAPVSFLDPDAVEKAVRLWSEAEHRRALAPPQEAITKALKHLPLLYREQHEPDLISIGIHAVARLFEHIS